MPIECLAGDWFGGYAGKRLPQRLLQLCRIPAVDHPEVQCATFLGRAHVKLTWQQTLSCFRGETWIPPSCCIPRLCSTYICDAFFYQPSLRREQKVRSFVEGRCTCLTALHPTHDVMTPERPLHLSSHIRETMVKIMMTPDPRRRRAVGDGGRKSWQVDDVEAGGERIAFRARGLPMDPSICIFWCAVALGALARGSPLQTVSAVLVGCPGRFRSREKGLLHVFGVASTGQSYFDRRCCH